MIKLFLVGPVQMLKDIRSIAELHTIIISFVLEIHKYIILTFGCFDKILTSSKPTYPVAPAIAIFNESFIFINYIS